MGLEHLAAVWEHSRQSGSHLNVLLAVASYSDHRGEWTIDQATLERRTRLSNRQVRRILTELVAAGELAVTSHHGRGKLSTYRLALDQEINQEHRLPGTDLPAPKPDAAVQSPCGKPDTAVQFHRAKPDAEAQFPAPPCPPFPPDPQFPLYPPELRQETFGLRPLSGPQSAVFRVNRLLEESAIPLPSPAQIGLWTKTLGGIEPLLALLTRLIHAGLANKHTPLVYAHRAVIEPAAHPEPAPQASSPSPRSLRAGRPLNPLHFAGSDEARRRQAERIMAATRPAPRGTT